MAPTLPARRPRPDALVTQRVRVLPPRYPTIVRFDVELAGTVGRYGRQLWTRCRLRKRHTCLNCWTHIERGQRGYRPLTNGDNRMDRLCVTCVEADRPVPNAHEIIKASNAICWVTT